MTRRAPVADRTTLVLARIRRTQPPRLERDIQAEILRALRAHGIMAYPMNREKAGRRRATHIGVKGLPDIGGWVPGKWLPAAGSGIFISPIPLYIEVKRPGLRTTPPQTAFLAMAAKAGCVAFKAESVADVARELGWRSR